MEHLDAQCEPQACLNSVSLSAYYTTSQTMFSTALQFLSVDDLARAYVFFKRYVNLCLVTLPKHNSFSLKQFTPDRVLAKRQCSLALDELERIRPVLMATFAAEAEAAVAQCDDGRVDAVADAMGRASLHDAPKAASTSSASTTTAAAAAVAAVGAAAAGAAAVSGATSAPRSATAPLRIALFPGMLPTPSMATPFGGAASASCECDSHAAPSAGYPVVGVAAVASTALSPQPASSAAQRLQSELQTHTRTQARAHQHAAASTAAALAASSVSTTAASTSSPFASAPTVAAHCSSSRALPAPPPPSLKPIIVPANLVADFLRLAAPNTALNRETCAVLAGRVDAQADAFRVTHAILPKQQGTANTVVTSSEEELTAVQCELDVLTLGWIHTHPTQDCFLSSVDLHTHHGYQVRCNNVCGVSQVDSTFCSDACTHASHRLPNPRS